MSIALKPYVNINVDESIVAQELLQHFKDGHVFVTIKDKGVDLILLPTISKRSRPVRIQVKGSKYHFNIKKGIKDPNAGGWVTISEKKLKKYVKTTDYVIFIIYNIEVNKKNVESIEITKDALKFATKFFVEEAVVRSQEKLNPERILKKLNINY